MGAEVKQNSGFLLRTAMEKNDLLNLLRIFPRKPTYCCKAEQPTTNHHFKIPSLKLPLLRLAQKILANKHIFFFLEMLPNWIFILLTIRVRMRKYGMGKVTEGLLPWTGDTQATDLGATKQYVNDTRCTFKVR